ncbi:MAG TPA: nucleoid occlusion factor SlmA [Rheinheimera sp.]|nr:nucleoid occlusion factor SlmA [Rheinheimera sp.]
MTHARPTNRKQEILQALAVMLEKNPGQRITTAALAERVGVSEAALYRHFPSKARMFEGLIEFIEESLQKTIFDILQKHKQTEHRVQLIVQMLLLFAEKNPGMCRLLTGEALQGEQERLRERIALLFDKLEQQLKQCLRERRLREGKPLGGDEAALASLLLATVEGKIHQFVRSGFVKSPYADFRNQWEMLRHGLFGVHQSLP